MPGNIHICMNILSILTWLINTLLNPCDLNRKSNTKKNLYRNHCIWMKCAHNAHMGNLLCMISCAPDHTDRVSEHCKCRDYIPCNRDEWVFLFRYTVTQTPTVKGKYVRTTLDWMACLLTHAHVQIDWIDVEHAWKATRKRSHTQIIQMKTNKQPF